MYLKELCLHGFKSFPDKVRLEFKDGITAVVGPNGSGKSNISDAIRWVLGEQKIRNLRGDKLEDVIFSGTDSRKPIGFAEVSITLDNEDKMMSLDFSEITVKRTVFRSGESKYTINGTPCRLKDINELFMDTGIGREGYSIIGQGRIDEILNAKSEDRRRLFEEAAGIAKYRSRRAESLTKLERERENLLRINDIISEIESGLEPLKIQSENAQKYLVLKERLRKCDISLFFIKAKKIDEQAKSTAHEAEILKNDIAENKKQHDRLKDKRDSLKEAEKELVEAIEFDTSKISRLSAEKERKNGDIRLLEEQRANLKYRLKEAENDILQDSEKSERISAEINIIKSKIMAFDVNIAHLKSALSSKENEFNDFKTILSKSEEKLNWFKSDIFEKMRVSSELKTKIEGLKANISQTSDRVKENESMTGVLEGKLKQARVHFMLVNKKISETEDEIKAKNDIVLKLKEEKNIISQKFLAYEDKLRKYNSELSVVTSKYRVLNEMKNDFEGYYKSVKGVLKAGKSGRLNGICGAIGEILSSPEKYETAVEISLGQSIQNIVTEDELSAKSAIEYLRLNNLGRATFMPISVMKGRNIDDAEKERILNYSGVLGIAVDVVEFDKRYYDVVSNLLGRIIIAENIDFALKVSALTGRKYKIVTLNGDVVNAGGSMTGGSISKKSSGIFGRNREIEELILKGKALREEIKNAEYNLDDIKESQKENNLKLSDTTLLIHKLELELKSFNEELKTASEDVSGFELRLSNASAELKLFNEKMENAGIELKKLEKQAAEAEEDIKKSDTEMTEYQKNVDIGRNKSDFILNEISDIKIKITSAGHEKDEAEREKERLESELSASENQKIDSLSLKEEYLRGIDEKEKELEESKKILFDIEENIKKTQESFESNTNKKETCKKELDEKAKSCDETALTIAKLENTVFKYDTKLEALNSQKEELFKQAWEDYEITFESSKEFYDENISYTELENLSGSIKNEIRLLGNVNTGSIDEFARVKGRYDFLSEQRDDIKKAEENLIQIIDDLGELMKKQFSEQFDVISSNFNQVFREMFGGGKAYLKLSDSSDILESGIEIIAQPPGKTMQNMLLLSGGERALTAIAILFAILKMKPSPFCVLDEIEAALDDANVKRFANYLRNFSKDTQFIVISHRKGTMEAADVLYGVTMQEKGISKVISVKFDDIKESGERDGVFQ